MKTNIIFELTEAADRCGISPEVIKKFISYEWINPADPMELMLDEEDIARAQLIYELEEDLGVNDEAVPIILHLIDQLNHLHLECKERLN